MVSNRKQGTENITAHEEMISCFALAFRIPETGVQVVFQKGHGKEALQGDLE